MKVESLHIYPIKGMGGINVTRVNAFEKGFQYDRRWMLIDVNGNFITQRTDKRLALFRCKLRDNLEVSFNEDSIAIDLNNSTHRKILCTVWDSQVFAFEVSDEASHWFSERLGLDCKLVKMVYEYDRIKKLIKGPEQTTVSFADGYPYLIVGSASLDKVNTEIGDEIAKSRFRANIIVETDIPHMEDEWNEISIGGARMQVIKACARCNVINIDQESAILGKEPLKSLTRYRKVGNKVNFGANTICLSDGVIALGDSVVIHEN